MNRNRFLLALFLVVLAMLMRVVPHPWNFTPIGGVALFSGASFERKRWSFLVPLLALFAGDVALELLTGQGFHALMPAVYGSFAATVCLGFLVRDHRHSPFAVGGTAVAGATLFFVVTNFAVWIWSPVYAKTLDGLVACYVAGLPYYGTQVAGDLIYSTLLFGAFVWMERHVLQLARR